MFCLFVLGGGEGLSLWFDLVCFVCLFWGEERGLAFFGVRMGLRWLGCVGLLALVFASLFLFALVFVLF